MAAWSILLLIVVIILVYIVVSKIYYEHKIKTGRRNLVGKVIFFIVKIQWTHTQQLHIFKSKYTPISLYLPSNNVNKIIVFPTENESANEEIFISEWMNYDQIVSIIINTQDIINHHSLEDIIFV